MMRLMIKKMQNQACCQGVNREYFALGAIVSLGQSYPGHIAACGLPSSLMALTPFCKTDFFGLNPRGSRFYRAAKAGG
ncbi:MAG: hypothetical protein IBX50_19370 [Marinospirillum sp.]|uniref:hypothetical protein n=1 Tax=Marinospirillum sp. TaxID=2183934 RepID=UPI0019FBE4D4|nr:hypothetical protein [Marinospirillum sp.]MBE0508850.1 hypothetical protein [Marinospirillum sp.]